MNSPPLQSFGTGWAWENSGRAGQSPAHPDYRLPASAGTLAYFDGQRFVASSDQFHGQDCGTKSLRY